MNIITVNTILYCSKWNETVAFYENKLKLEVAASFEWFVEFKLNDGSCLSVANEERASIGSSGGQGLTIAIKIDDLMETHSHLKEAGLNPTLIKDHPWGAKVFYIYDPEGNRIEFWSQNAIND